MATSTNDYNKLGFKYRESGDKPDKFFSILPTVMRIIGDIRDKIVLDCGCGDGFFTEPLALAGAKQVIGIDNSTKQIELAGNRRELSID
jgi:2-polyprenyl-3-methyl-5-hydroxy-6-metoxy-1,4-benzoquinol methylase